MTNTSQCHLDSTTLYMPPRALDCSTLPSLKADAHTEIYSCQECAALRLEQEDHEFKASLSYYIANQPKQIQFTEFHQTNTHTHTHTPEGTSTLSVLPV